MKRGTLIVTFVWFFLLIGGLYSYAADVRGVTDTTIRVGVIADTTSVAAFVGKSYLEAARNYYHHINDNGGIHGRKIKVYHEDSQYKIPKAIAAFKKLVTMDKVFYLHSFGTPEVTALLPYFKRKKVVTMPGSQSSTLVSPVQRHLFMPTATYKDEMYVIVDFLHDVLKIKNPRIAVVYADNAFGRNGLINAKERCKAYGFKVMDEEPAKWGAVDYSSQILRMKKAKIEYVIINMIANTTASCLKGAKRFDFNPQFIGTSNSVELTTVKHAGVATRGVIGTAHFPPWDSNAPGMVKLREITEKYAPGKGGRGVQYVVHWVISMAFAKGMEMAGRNLNTESLIEGLERIKDFNTGGLTAPLTFGPNRHQGSYSVSLYMPNVEQKTLFPISGWRETKKLR